MRGALTTERLDGVNLIARQLAVAARQSSRYNSEALLAGIVVAADRLAADKSHVTATEPSFMSSTGSTAVSAKPALILRTANAREPRTSHIDQRLRKWLLIVDVSMKRCVDEGRPFR
ncbi:hypothetical protein AB0K00_22425 [Dactylosporangium sp. NPDC049525]|uniref:hypothetical protein n=1 Tax=Dactylosporangium sp. NPDC049525 TaxID=3154730 RepID=UPI003436369B